MADSQYFSNSKRGELHELKEDLHANNKDKKKEAVKRVIASMTIGKDVSSLFPDVVNCMQTSNIELKKLVYLYVINYAKVQPELAILAVNTFRKDSLDPNPLIRALAVRTMGCIRLDSIAEYLVEPLRRCCADNDPYVRKTAAICIAKLYDIRPDMVEDEGFLDLLKKLLSDSSPVVVANTVASLAEISDISGKNYLAKIFVSDETCVNRLLTALNECTEWGQVFILDALASYVPPNARVAESTVDRVTARLSHANSAVVLSAIKVILILMDKITNQDTLRAIQKKLCPPLVTLLSSEPEIEYVALRNIQLIIQKWPTILSNEVKMFFCKYNDPVYVKIEKLDILVRLANERNVDQVLSELREYSTEIDIEMVRRSIRTIGRVALKMPAAADRCVRLLMDLLRNQINYVAQECTIVMKDIFRKYPHEYDSIISTLCLSMDAMDEPEAKASMVWIIGEHSDKMKNAEDLLYPLIDTFVDESPNVQQQLLTAGMKLFLVRPKKNQKKIAELLKIATEEMDNPDIRDKAYIYWRILSKNPEAAKKVIFAERPAMNEETDAFDYRTLDKLIANVSMVASVYHKLPETFVKHHRPSVPRPSLSSLKSGNIDIGSGIGIGGSTDGGGMIDLLDVGDEEKQQQKENVERARKELNDAKYKSGSESDGHESSSDESDESGQPIDLLDMDEPPPQKSKKSVSISIDKPIVLSADTPGKGMRTGLEIRAVIKKNSGGPTTLYLTFRNGTPQQLNDFALQVNKNSFGFSPSAALQTFTLSPSSSYDSSVPLTPNQSNSNQPPATPLKLQVAVRCSLDLYYFDVLVPFSAALDDSRGGMGKEDFRGHWQKFDESRQSAIFAVSAMPLTPGKIIAEFEQNFMFYVAQRSADTFDAMYLSGVTVNNLLILAEVSLKKGTNDVKLVVRTDAAALAPLFNQMAAQILGLTFPG